MTHSDEISLRSSDDVPCPVSIKAVKLSITVKELLEDLDCNAKTEVPVKVKSDTLKKIVKWLERSKDKYTDPLPVKEEDRKLPELDEWDTQFCDNLDYDAKVDMILAANLLDIKPLLDIVCISVANLVKGQSPEELRKVLERTSKPIPDDIGNGIPGLQVRNKTEIPVGEPTNPNGESSKRWRE